MRVTLTDFARQELDLAGHARANPALTETILRIVDLFDRQVDSDWTARADAADVLAALLNRRLLTPVNGSNPAEWQDVSEIFDGRPMWQSRRDPMVFSPDGGHTLACLRDPSLPQPAPPYPPTDEPAQWQPEGRL